MKFKRILTVLSIILVMSIGCTAYASDIPRESIPENATEESVVIVERVIGDILSEVQNGLGYGVAMPKANLRIRKLILAGESGGFGYGILGPIAQNAVWQYRDMYLRPDFYRAAEEKVAPLIRDLIEYVRNGGSYEDARKQAYIRILQNQDASFNPEDCYMTDFCYWDIPWVDTAYFAVARKLLLSAL